MDKVFGSPSSESGTVKLTKLFNTVKPIVPNSLTKLWEDNLVNNPHIPSWYTVPQPVAMPTVSVEENQEKSPISKNFLPKV